MSKHMLTSSALALALMTSACGGEQSGPQQTTEVTSTTSYELELVAEGFDMPWGIAFLPEGGMLVSERDGRVSYVAPGATSGIEIANAPEAYVAGQGGMFDVVLDLDFASNRIVYVSYAKGSAEANGTAVFRARLSEDGTTFEDGGDIFVVNNMRATPAHYGGRMLPLPDGTLVLTLGEGFRYMQDAQDPMSDLGTIVRMNLDGSVPADNPFADGVDGLPHVWSYGHRNVQGIVFDEDTGRMYSMEHGPMGGDEINIEIAGANYGWPAITYGVNYDGSIITTETEAPGMEQPIVVWVPSIAPGGLELYTGDVYPDWKGDLFAAALAGSKIQRVDLNEAGEVVGEEALLEDFGARFRQIAQGPDGYLYVTTDEIDGGVYRIVPSE